MPLTEYWRVYLADWVGEAEDMLAPCEVDKFILALNAELARLGTIETAAVNLAAAADALLDVTVAATPDTHLMRVVDQIGGLNRAWKAYEKACKPKEIAGAKPTAT